MARRKHTPEQVIKKLRQAEVAMAEGGTVAQASRKIGVTEQTFYRWRAEYGGLRIDQARRLKQLETENGRLRRAVADLTSGQPDTEGGGAGKLLSASRRRQAVPSGSGAGVGSLRAACLQGGWGNHARHSATSLWPRPTNRS